MAGQWVGGSASQSGHDYQDCRAGDINVRVTFSSALVQPSPLVQPYARGSDGRTAATRRGCACVCRMKGFMLQQIAYYFQSVALIPYIQAVALILLLIGSVLAYRHARSVWSMLQVIGGTLLLVCWALSRLPQHLDPQGRIVPEWLWQIQVVGSACGMLLFSIGYLQLWIAIHRAGAKNI